MDGGGHNRLAEARPSFNGIEIESFEGNILCTVQIQVNQSTR